MNHLTKPLSLAITLISTSQLAHANQIEEVVVKDVKADRSVLAADLANATAADAADLLRAVPGANVNSLGPITGIAQYRGMYGDRVSVSLDGGPVYNGGPNSMDAPLSYAPSSLLSQLDVTRGIASVSVGQETIGGHISASLDRGQFGADNNVTFSGKLTSRYQSASSGTSTALQAVGANDSHKVAALFSYDDGDDSDYADGTLTGTKYERSRYDLSYGYRDGDTNMLLYAGHNETNDSGTPALAMDIEYIDTDLAGLNIQTRIQDVMVSGYLTWSDVSHGMDNFSNRQSPMPPMYRYTQADAEHLSFGLSGELALATGTLEVGFDASRKDQDATVTNPNNAMFEVANFNGISRDIDGLFVQWRAQVEQFKLEAGIRHNSATLDADAVSASGMMGMNANMLAMVFNNSDRSRTFNYTDLVFKAGYTLDSNTTVELGLARKHRAPSYQEMYLWLPMQATGGLADGRSYIGNLQLNEEQANEITLGLNWDNGSAYFTPQAFFRDVADYIQGTPTMNMTANMVANMMSGAPALQFNNVDAELYGLDAGYGYTFNQNWRLDGGISYVQGQRTDADDYLYRIAPLNHRLALSYQQDKLRLHAESIVYASQEKVSLFNTEQRTAGYGLINLRAHYDLNQWATLSAGVENLFDNGYQDHLAGYNRAMGSDVAVGDRMYGVGQNVYLAIQLSL